MGDAGAAEGSETKKANAVDGVDDDKVEAIVVERGVASSMAEGSGSESVEVKVPGTMPVRIRSNIVTTAV